MLVLLAASLPGLAVAQECAADGTCDTHSRCSAWREEGQCYKNKKYMREHCPVACREVDMNSRQRECVDAHPRCAVWAELGECSDNTDMKRYCAKSCDSCLNSDDNCLDNHEKCEMWASSGECQANPNYMLKNCQKSCNSCPTKNSSKRDDSKTAILQLSTSFGEKQEASGAQATETLKVVEETIEYMRSNDFTSLAKDIQETCLNRKPLCSFWALIGKFQFTFTSLSVTNRSESIVPHPVV